MSQLKVSDKDIVTFNVSKVSSIVLLNHVKCEIWFHHLITLSSVSDIYFKYSDSIQSSFAMKFATFNLISFRKNST